MKEQKEKKVTIFRKSLCGFSENPQSTPCKIHEINTEIEQHKEQDFVNLMIDIIVSMTLKQLYEEGD
ncbi:MAG: hypothetical protein CMP76_16285 [Flavobacterium sp.]|jgi:hypothetical protein|uniref:hypothetical protein n=1 Tax=Flavobacterium sp. TaxID=239 RepID=UPI000C483643|nr:hypothetical protein [Flavobacterium sp.]MBF04841.1 hypothetical protein [Flavobacterium sp.]|tara:strand:- start:16889 stop:17089 length:201 start_codon:yes stop_codon:yes gene_type:complete